MNTNNVCEDCFCLLRLSAQAILDIKTGKMVFWRGNWYSAGKCQANPKPYKANDGQA